MKTSLMVTVLVMVGGCGGEVLCDVEMQSTLERAEPEACPEAGSDEVVEEGRPMPTYSSLARLTTRSRELTAPLLFTTTPSAPAATVCWYGSVSRVPSQCAGDTRPGNQAVVTREAYRTFGLPQSGTVMACSSSKAFTHLDGRVTTTDDPSSVSCAMALPTDQPLVAHDELPARRECTYRWKREYRCVYDRGLGSVGGFGSPGGP